MATGSPASARACPGALLLAALCLLAAALAPAPARAAERCNGSRALCARSLDRVVLAGAHNAMSSASLGWQIPNQSVAIPGQLRRGIRALLLDAHYGRRQPDGTVVTDDDGRTTTGKRGRYLCHVACQLGSTSLVEGFRQVRRFVKAHPHNVLVIVVEDYVTPADLVAAAHTSGLTKSVYRGSTRRWPTLRRMIARRQQVVMLAEHHAGAARWYHLAYRGILQETPYTFKTPDLLTDRANFADSCRPNRGGRRGSLFLMNHWSPDVPPPEPDLAASARVNDPRVVVARAQACRRLRGRLPTIVAADQITAGGDAVVAAVRELNRRTPRWR